MLRSLHKRIQTWLGRGSPSGASAGIVLPESQNSDSDQYAQARAFHQQGQLDKAEAIYRSLLQKYPQDFDLLHLLGTTLGQRNDFASAAALIRQAIAVDPGNPAAHGSLGNCLKGLGKLDEALECYDRALVLRPDDADVWNNRGTALSDLKRPAEALESYERALALRPHFVQAHYNRAIVLVELKRPDEARTSLESALAINPDHVDALITLGTVLGDMKQYEAAQVSYERALKLRPHDPILHYQRGNLLHILKQYETALQSYQQALLLRPGFTEALANQGATLRALNRHNDALNALDRALQIEPDHSTAHCYRGIVLDDVKRYQDALASFDRALVFDPDSVEAHDNRGRILRQLRRFDEALVSHGKALLIDPNHQSSLFNRGSLLAYMGRPEDAAADYSRLVTLSPDYEFAQGYLLQQKMACCDWRGLSGLLSTIVNNIRMGKCSTVPSNCFSLLDSPDFLKSCAELYAAKKFLSATTKPASVSRLRNNKIRVGYVAGEFRHHATAILTVELFEQHDTSRFELFAFDNGWDDGSDIRKRLSKAFGEFVDIARLNDAQAADAIRNRGIDILVDLNGHVGFGRTLVFKHRPAPIQVNWLGYPGTMGAPYIDYIIGDSHVIPEGHEIYYTEKVVRLPDTYQVNDSKRAFSTSTPTRAQVGLPDAAFVFCCFNKTYKITPGVFDIWMRLLSKVEDSLLWLLQENAAAAGNLRAEAEARGVAPNRLVFAPRMTLPDHLARHRLADLFLDTIPCNAHTTASDALWAGLPLLTCMGNTFPGRVAGSLLHAVGLPELITDNLADYEALALKLATNPALLARLRTRLARNRTTHPLFDTDRFRRHIECAYTSMYERWQLGKAPANITVPREYSPYSN